MKILNMPRASWELGRTHLEGAVAFAVTADQYEFKAGDVLLLLEEAPAGAALFGVTKDLELLSVTDALAQGRALTHFAVTLIRALGVSTCESAS